MVAIFVHFHFWKSCTRVGLCSVADGWVRKKVGKRWRLDRAGELEPYDNWDTRRQKQPGYSYCHCDILKWKMKTKLEIKNTKTKDKIIKMRRSIILMLVQLPKLYTINISIRDVPSQSWAYFNGSVTDNTQSFLLNSNVFCLRIQILTILKCIDWLNLDAIYH